MLRIIQNTSAQSAKSYYTEGLSREDYYSEGQEIIGEWGGQGAKALGLTGTVQREAFEALCDNRDPLTGEQLTPRTRQSRRVGYDMNFHCPKSLSVLYAETGDTRILDAFRESVGETMEELETEMKTRVRGQGQNSDRTTGNLIWGEFIHFTARPVDGIPDPHLHAHCFTFNTTFDPIEGRWKAGQFGDIKRDARYFEAGFHARLARRMEQLGYRTERTGKGWEIAGMPASVIEKFSRRTAAIEETAAERNITDDRAKDGLGALTRESKNHTLTKTELKTQWHARLSPAERDAIRNITEGDTGTGGNVTADQALDYALSHRFERASVVAEKKILEEALRYGVGSVTPDAIRDAAERSELLIRNVGDERMATTRSVLEEEKAMLVFARSGRGVCAPLHPGEYRFKTDYLSAEQRTAVAHVLSSSDRVMEIRGKAGTGKTTLTREVVAGIEEGGKQVFLFAPSAEAARGVLRQEGFAKADTVARLLADPDLQEKTKNQVIWVDEAGMLGVRQMNALFQIAREQNARVVLVGDTRQHGAVERGDALRILETEAGIHPAEITHIRRQSGSYRQAVSDLSHGDIKRGLAKLDQLGWIREIPNDNRYEQLAGDYLGTVKAGKSALIVSPTHKEGEKVTALIREGLQKAEALSGNARDVTMLRNLYWTQAQRQDPIQYAPGLVVQFHQNAKGVTKGERLTVVGRQQDGAVMAQRDDGSPVALPLEDAAGFSVYRPQSISLMAGDRLRITQNGWTRDKKHRLNNGAMYEIAGFTKAGDMRLSNGWVIGQAYGNLAYGYVTTSHAAQGKTVDRVFIAQSADSFPASSREQFYVSVSRGREQAVIYTDDKQGLTGAISASSERRPAAWLAGKLRQCHRNLAKTVKETPLLHRLIHNIGIKTYANAARQWIKEQSPPPAAPALVQGQNYYHGKLRDDPRDPDIER